MLDIAILTANAAQLKHILILGNSCHFFNLMITLIILSIILQVDFCWNEIKFIFFHLLIFLADSPRFHHVHSRHSSRPNERILISFCQICEQDNYNDFCHFHCNQYHHYYIRECRLQIRCDYCWIFIRICFNKLTIKLTWYETEPFSLFLFFSSHSFISLQTDKFIFGIRTTIKFKMDTYSDVQALIQDARESSQNSTTFLQDVFNQSASRAIPGEDEIRSLFVSSNDLNAKRQQSWK